MCWGGSSDDVRFAQRQDAIRAMTDLRVVFIGILCTFTARNVVPELSGMVEHKPLSSHVFGEGSGGPEGWVPKKGDVPKGGAPKGGAPKGGALKGGSPDGHDRLWPIRL